MTQLTSDLKRIWIDTSIDQSLLNRPLDRLSNDYKIVDSFSPDKVDIVLSENDQGIKLQWYQTNEFAINAKQGKPKKQCTLNKPLEFFIDIDAFVSQQKTFPAPKQGAFNQALGKKTNTVIDATAGWGGDALLMCSQGYAVHLIERNPLMALLLDDAMRRLSKTAWAEKHSVIIPTVIHANAIDWLKKNKVEADCVYLDPMFPVKRKKSAATNKNMQFLQWLLDADHDAGDLLASAFENDCKRIAVKRPDYALPLNFREVHKEVVKPSNHFSSKLLHYDVYLKI